MGGAIRVSTCLTPNNGGSPSPQLVWYYLRLAKHVRNLSTSPLFAETPCFVRSAYFSRWIYPWLGLCLIRIQDDFQRIQQFVRQVRNNEFQFSNRVEAKGISFSFISEAQTKPRPLAPEIEELQFCFDARFGLPNYSF